MGLNTISRSVGHIIGHTLGLNLVAWIGFDGTWCPFIGVLILAMVMLVFLKRMVAAEKAGR